ncbi:hypothetical protein SAMN04487914_12221 [Arthrobacter sp. ok909]|nr:hypothetical protein SAMN04487914_12221 [Arthrobacter sp. ok909]
MNFPLANSVAAAFGGVRESDVAAYIEEAFAKTAERIATGQLPENNVADEA